MNEEVKNILKDIVKILVEKYNPERIILFGSYAYGKSTKDSDIDLLIITENEIPFEKRLQLKQRVGESLSIPIQIILMTSKEFYETKDIIGGIAYPASRYGEVLYEKSWTGNLGFCSTLVKEAVMRRLQEYLSKGRRHYP
mgnify:CR=1 FL=1